MTPQHPTDADLLLWADRDLAPAHTTEIDTHVNTCRSCRHRLTALEGTITDFARHRNSPAIPSAAGPRALLRARLAAEAALSPAAPSRIWNLARVGAVCFTLFAAFLLIFEFRMRADGPQPDPTLTPGEIQPISMTNVCRTTQAEVIVENIPAQTRAQVFAAYGLNPANPGDYEVDYLITPDLGGSDGLRNLWPQPYAARWSAKEKDKLEQRLHQLVCAGTMDLPTAQHEIAGNWIRAYKKYVQPAAR